MLESPAVQEDHLRTYHLRSSPIRERLMSNAETAHATLPEKMPVRTREVETAFTAVYDWSYGGELEKIRDLYALSLNHQWHALRDLDWEGEWDTSRFVTSFTVSGVPVHRSTFWKELPPDLKAEIQRRVFAYTLSNILHGEQGALM